MPARPLVLPRRVFAALVALSLIVSGCGGGSGSDDGEAQLRVINATVDIGAVDLTIDNDSIDETAFRTTLAADTASEYSTVASGRTHTFRLKRAGGSSTVAAYAHTPSAGATSTLLAWGREGALRLSVLSDDESAPASGRAKVRAFNGAIDAGSLDVYLTESDTLLDEVSPTLGGVSGAQTGSYADIAQGTYRLRVTAKDDKTDLRLDIAAVEIGSQQRVTIVVQPSAGGVLVHALVVRYRDTPEVQKNPSARARLVAGVGSNGTVTATIGTKTLNVGLRSPAVGVYALVPAGSQALAVTVNGSLAIGGTTSINPGGDYTLLVYGEATAPALNLISDDNRLPSSTSKAKLRLVNGAPASYGGLTLAKDYLSVANDVAYGTASAMTLVDAASDTLLQVTSALSVTALYENADAVLLGSGVYTTFVLGGGSTPVGVLRRDR